MADNSDVLAFTAGGNKWEITLTRHSDGEITWGAKVNKGQGFERVPGDKVPKSVAKKASDFQKQAATKPAAEPTPAPEPEKRTVAKSAKDEALVALRTRKATLEALLKCLGGGK